MEVAFVLDFQECFTTKCILIFAEFGRQEFTPSSHGPRQRMLDDVHQLQSYFSDELRLKILFSLRSVHKIDSFDAFSFPLGIFYLLQNGSELKTIKLNFVT